MTGRKPFEELYPVKENYERFDQRNTSFSQKKDFSAPGPFYRT